MQFADNLEECTRSWHLTERSLCNLWFADDIDLLKQLLVMLLYGNMLRQRQKSSSAASSQSRLPWMNEKSVRRSGLVRILGIHTNQGRTISKGCKDQTGTGTISNDKVNSKMKKTKPSAFLQRLNCTSQLSYQYCIADVRAGRWRRIERSKSRPLKTNATGECLAYHAESMKETNMYGNRSISSPDVSNFNSQPSSVTSYHGSAMSAITIRCQKSYLQGTVDDNHRRGRPRN